MICNRQMHAQDQIDFEALGELAYKYATEDIDSCYIYTDSIAYLATPTEAGFIWQYLVKAFKKKLNAKLSIRNQNGTFVELEIKNYKKVA